nr:MAG TPA: hypothetical protein [Caudoviricetes sp.]
MRKNGAIPTDYYRGVTHFPATVTHFFVRL